ncbi:hypothetical protein ACTFIZ_012520 [Dictyostelium cf. discoideum]
MEKLIIIIIYLLSTIPNLCISAVPPNELSCAENLATKFDFKGYFPNNDYCGNSSIIDCKNSSIIGVSITFIKISSMVLTEQDISCFPNLEKLYIMYLTISQSFLNYNITKGKKIDLIDVSCPNCRLTQKLGNYIFYSFISSENLVFNIGLVCHIVQVALISISGFYLEGPTEFTECNSNRMTLFGINYPDFSNMNSLSSVYLNLVDSFDQNSILNFSTISSSYVEIYHFTSVPFYYNQNFKISELSIEAPFENINQLSKISFVNNTNYKSIVIKCNGNSNFNFNGELPIILNNNVTFEFINSNLTKVPSLSEFGDYDNKITFSNNKFLDLNLPIYDGNGINYIFDSNGITGTIDKSWCNTILSIKDNKMNGEIPSCYQCYFNYTGNSKIPNIYNGFSGNQFTNYDKNIPCTTFRPQIKIINSTTLNVFGDDIGFDPYLWKFNGSIIMNSAYQINKFGSDYICNIGSYIGLDYFSILFTIPHEFLYTFPIIEKPIFVSNLTISNDNIYTFSGLYFSSYISYKNQSILIDGFECNQISTNFFETKCYLPPPPQTPSINKGNLNLVNIVINKFQNKFYINSTIETGNEMTCLNCNGNSDICDKSSGNCFCENGKYYSGCLCLDLKLDIECFQTNPFISSISPSTTDGGISTIFGSFGSINFNYSVLIDGTLCNGVNYISNNEIIFISPPGNGIKILTLIINGLSSLNAIYRYENKLVKCPGYTTTNCSGNGICKSNGECQCNSGWTSFDCSIILNNYNNNNGDGGGEIPQTYSVVDTNSGGTNILNQDVKFQIYLKTLKEINYQGKTIKEYQLQNNWNLNSTFSSSSSSSSNLIKQYKFSQNLIENKETTIISLIEEVVNPDGKEYRFAGTQFKLNQGSIKFTISIYNYSFQSNLNTLQLDLISTVDQSTITTTATTNSNDNECNSKSIEIDTSNINDLSNFNYIKISKNNKILEGRFINKVVSDGRATFFSTTITNDSNSIIVSLNLPHCKSECIIDPDFSLIVSPDFKSECNNNNNNENSKWLIPVVVVIPLICISVLITISILIYMKRVRSNHPLMKLIKLNKNKNNNNNKS